jgi:hypothetical protein
MSSALRKGFYVNKTTERPERPADSVWSCQEPTRLSIRNAMILCLTQYVFFAHNMLLRFDDRANIMLSIVVLDAPVDALCQR